jgi:hypothetical protein
MKIQAEIDIHCPHAVGNSCARRQKRIALKPGRCRKEECCFVCIRYEICKSIDKWMKKKKICNDSKSRKFIIYELTKLSKTPKYLLEEEGVRWFERT